MSAKDTYAIIQLRKNKTTGNYKVDILASDSRGRTKGKVHAGQASTEELAKDLVTKTKRKLRDMGIPAGNITISSRTKR